MAYPVPTKAFLQPSSDTTMLFAPFRCTHPPPLPTLSAHAKTQKNVARSDNRNWKFHSAKMCH